jgi:transposase-like protein
MPGKIYSDEVRASALASLALGMSTRAVAREHQIPRSTVVVWQRNAGLTGQPLVQPQKRRDLGELIAHYLDTGLQALEAQARLFSDPVWLERQSASELAILHGVLTDKLIKVLASLESDEFEDDEPLTLDAASPPDPSSW